ncbi:YlmC/YmxH family sporulation protein [Clostridium fallax]|uniref:Sporulation protein, YlmC/YmxH family n=1 Tax=Clostridium fallax TaxID=1533 RepID=A0A1M4X6Q0_9CLOT|nr:YlmC/YmxH family sporulation protein [Clostridium fallax]SHE89170.1 sporulation protein, YlmC/YmxH family [Clostridium fallax]SQB07327.1 PRC-barrel domain-containing protein [Clostridium fallax]
MEFNFHSLNNIKNMEIIDLKLGAKIGFIRDLKINCDESKIESILIPIQKNSFFGKMEFIEIPWSDIIKIGVDVILVDTKGKLEGDN